MRTTQRDELQYSDIADLDVCEKSYQRKQKE